MNLPTTLMGLLLGKRFPKTEGEVAVSGLQSEVVIRRDAYGVPYIHADNELDAWYGLGFCHGQDRPFQLEVLVRLMRGELAALFGEALLPVDRLSRRIGYRRAGLGHLSVMPEFQCRVLHAYVEGINNGFAHGLPKKPHEFALLRTEATPWESADVAGFLNYMGMNLSTWESKLTRLYILMNDGMEALDALDTGYPEWQPVTSPVQGLAGESLNRLMQDAQDLTQVIGAGASNNWAIGRSRTASGNPILANDPHLSPILPTHWYLAHVRYPDLTVCGASFVGIPLIPSGFNGTAAWGITAGLVDGIDLFIEKLDRENGLVRNPAGFEPCERIPERYTVKGKDEPFEEEIWITPRGPVVSDLMEGFDQTLSMKATWMTPRPLDGLTYFHMSTSFENCRANFEHLYAASLNVAYADTSGTIGWQLIGEAPRRKKGWGVLPMPGWEAAYDWGQDHITIEEMPWLMDPPEDFLATANNLPQQEGAGPYLGRDFSSYRQPRILECLASRQDWDLEKTQDLQLDQFTIPWREMKDSLLGHQALTPEAGLAVELLQGWDGVLAKDSAPAALFKFTVTELAHMLARQLAPNSFRQVLGKGFSLLFSGSPFFIQHTSLVSRFLAEQPEDWFEETFEEVLDQALAEAYGRLQDKFGRDPQDWQWGRVHELMLRHRFGSRKPFDRIFNRGPYPIGGDGTTVSAAGASTGKHDSNVDGMANLRMAVEVGDWEQNYFIIAGGQSGNPLSPHYDDLLALWLEGKAIRMAWGEEEIAAISRKTLTIRPA